MDFLKNFKFYSDFDEKINEYINDINVQYNLLQKNMKIIKYDETMSQQLNSSLDELNDFIEDYYKKANSSYYKNKEFIQNSINQINNLLEKSIRITSEEIKNKYLKIKNDFKPVNYSISKEKSIEISKKTETIDETKYTIETTIDKYLLQNEIYIKIILEEIDDIIIPKVIGKIINKNHPNKISIDFYSKYGQMCGKKGRKYEF